MNELIKLSGLFLAFVVNMAVLGGHFWWLIEMPKIIGHFWTISSLLFIVWFLLIVNFIFYRNCTAWNRRVKEKP